MGGLSPKRDDDRVGTHLRPAWNSENAPTVKKPDAMMGRIHGIEEALVQPKKSSEILMASR